MQSGNYSASHHCWRVRRDDAPLPLSLPLLRAGTPSIAVREIVGEAHGGRGAAPAASIGWVEL